MNVLQSGNPETIRLLPREIQIDPQYNVRPYSSQHTDAEDKRIEELAGSMERVGQLDNLLITPKHVLICGHRRHKAAIVINERRSVRGESLYHLTCTVDRAGGDMWRKSIQSNLQRKESSVMDLAYLITQIRARFGWKGPDSFTRLAEYLGVDRTTVYRAERFLSAPGALQTMLHNGEVSAQSALHLMRVPAKEQPKAIELARRFQQEDQLEKVLNVCERANKSPEEAAVLICEPEKRIEAPAVARAVRTVSAASRVPLTRTELIDGLSRQEQSHLSASHHYYLDYLLNTFIAGKGTIKELRARFSAIGTPLGISTADNVFVHSPPN